MASSHTATHHTPLLADSRRRSEDSTAADYNHISDNHTPIAIYGLVLGTTSPTRPFATTLLPTLFNRSLALLLLLPAFVIFCAVNGPHFAATIVFLSFAIARQLVVLGRHHGGQLVKVHVEIVHPTFKDLSNKVQERWIQRSVAGTVDGVILVGLLVTLALDAKEVSLASGAMPAATAGVVLGFVAFGLLLNSVADFGNPSLVNVAVAIEKPVPGVLKLAYSVHYGEPDQEVDYEDVETGQASGKRQHDGV